MSFLLIQTTGAAGPAGAFIQYLPLLLIFGIFYFLLFLPMQKQKKAQQAMLKGLKNGDTVLTNGGIIGIILSIGDDDSLILRVKPDNVKLTVTRGAVASIINQESKS
jgi:preprotein translocase subunit YajC